MSDSAQQATPVIASNSPVSNQGYSHRTRQNRSTSPLSRELVQRMKQRLRDKKKHNPSDVSQSSGAQASIGSSVNSKQVSVIDPASTDFPPRRISQLQALDTLDSVLDEVEAQAKNRNEPDKTKSVNDNEKDALATPQISPDQLSVLSQVAPQVVDQASDTLNPPIPVAGTGAKEAVEGSGVAQLEVGGGSGGGPAEYEKAKEFEVPVEVEAYMQKVEDHQQKILQEIVVADDGTTISQKPYPKQPVIVLPITPEEEDEGQKKPPSFSIRWLVEWSQKLMKKFAGKIIYRQSEE